MERVTVTLSTNAQQTFSVVGRDQYGEPIAIESIAWNSTNGTISPTGEFQAPDTEGSITLTASCDGLTSTTRISIVATETDIEDDADDSNGDDDGKQATTKHERHLWKGEIPPQKWMQLYTKILTKLVSDKTLEVTLSLNIDIQGELSEQRRSEMRVALQELGLDSDINSQ